MSMRQGTDVSIGLERVAFGLGVVISLPTLPRKSAMAVNRGQTITLVGRLTSDLAKKFKAAEIAPQMVRHECFQKGERLADSRRGKLGPHGLV